MCWCTTKVNDIHKRQCVVDLSTAYYNSSPQVTRLLARVQDVISAAAARERHQSTSQVSELAAASRNGQPRAIRDRLALEEYERLVAAARAGACKKALAIEFGISRRSIYRLLTAA
jgi:DNA invertase Pin-like site-specific DNA recombinase